jgi:hypothetical protein
VRDEAANHRYPARKFREQRTSRANPILMETQWCRTGHTLAGHHRISLTKSKLTSDMSLASPMSGSENNLSAQQIFSLSFHLAVFPLVRSDTVNYLGMIVPNLVFGLIDPLESETPGSV